MSNELTREQFDAAFAAQRARSEHTIACLELAYAERDALRDTNKKLRFELDKLKASCK